MQPDKEHSDEGDLQELPTALQADLRELFAQTPSVGRGIDSSILSEAKVTYERRRRFRPFLRRAALVGSIAAVLAVTVTIVSINHHAPPQIAQMGDVNHDGRVDILDAMVVAKAISEGGKLDPAWDVNHDGAVDQKDVDWIATMAVNVSGTGGRQ